MSPKQKPAAETGDASALEAFARKLEFTLATVREALTRCSPLTARKEFKTRVQSPALLSETYQHGRDVLAGTGTKSKRGASRATTKSFACWRKDTKPTCVI